MIPYTLIHRSLRFHARAHLGVVLGAAIGSAALIGALVLGDSVRQSLRDRALSRLGNIHYALSSGERFFRQDLGRDMAIDAMPHVLTTGPWAAWSIYPVEPSCALLLSCTVARQDGRARVNRALGRPRTGVDFAWRRSRCSP